MPAIRHAYSINSWTAQRNMSKQWTTSVVSFVRARRSALSSNPALQKHCGTASAAADGYSEPGESAVLL
ncbi:hypothetical protein [Paenibacillus sp. FSL R5-0912]|uniref:hypothetical protein n=1 Tax=Paenibacillus sp. FSL R5-0912 TaxID=1536771 RepID=UPI0018CE8FE5|nr:hypothetical protein [Paenibacillus sp. FSL R5-0912]